MANPLPDLPSLRELLDAGCDLDATGVWLVGIAEEVFTHLPVCTLVERLQRAAVALETARIYAEQDAGREPTWRHLWLAEVYQDEALADRLRLALPADLVAHYEPQTDMAKRPHPLAVKIPEGAWHCHNCGATFQEGQQEAVVVTERPPFSTLDYEIPYCLDCVESLAEVAKQRRSQ